MARQNMIDELVSNAIESMRQIVDANTTIGDAVNAGNDTTIIPVSRVTMGFGAGGSEIPAKESKGSDNQAEYPFGGGTGAGVSVVPVAFIVVTKNDVKLLRMENNTAADKLAALVPEAFELVKKAAAKKKIYKPKKKDVESVSGE